MIHKLSARRIIENAVVEVVVKPLFKHDKDLSFAACPVVYE